VVTVKKIMERISFMVYLKHQAPLKTTTEIDSEIVNYRQINFWQGITKLQNKYENQYVNSNASMKE
jgi:hypothetical protein